MDSSHLRAAPPWSARLALAVTVIAWASSFAAMRIAVTAFTPASIALLRFATTSIALGLVALALRRRGGGLRLPRGRDRARVAVIGALGLGIYNIALAAAQARLPAGTSSILIATAPLWMALIAVVVTGERLGGRARLGLAVGFAGVVLVKAGAGALGGDAVAIVVVLGAAILQAAYTMSQRPMIARHGPLAFLCCASWAATLVLAPALPGLLAELQVAPAGAIAAVAYMGLVPGALGYATWAHAATRVSTAEAGAALYLVPPVAMAIAYAALGEAPRAAALGGGALVLVAVALSRGR